LEVEKKPERMMRRKQQKKEILKTFRYTSGIFF